MARLPQPSLYAPDHTEPCHAFLPIFSPRQAKPGPSSPMQSIPMQCMPHPSPILFGIRRPSQSIPLLATPHHSSTRRATPCPTFSHPYLRDAPLRASTHLDRPIQTMSQHAPLFSPVLPRPCQTTPQHFSPHLTPACLTIPRFLPSFTRTAPCRTEPSLFQSIPTQAYHEQTTLHLLHHTNH